MRNIILPGSTDMRGKQEDKKMLMIVIAALVLGTMWFRRKALPEGTDEMIRPGHKTVKASVDGKPVHSYVSEDRNKG